MHTSIAEAHELSLDLVGLFLIDEQIDVLCSAYHIVRSESEAADQRMAGSDVLEGRGDFLQLPAEAG